MSETNGAVLKDYSPLQPRLHGKFIPKGAAKPVFTPAFGGATLPARGEPDPLAAVLGAMLLHAVQAAADDRDMVPGLQALIKLVRDRARLARLTGQPQSAVEKAYWAAEEKAWDSRLHPRDDHGRWVSRDVVQDARDDPKLAADLRKRVTRPAERRKLERAIAGETDVGRTERGHARHGRRVRREVQTGAVAAVRRLRRHVADHGVAPADLREFAAVLPHLDPVELRRTAELLGHVVAADHRQAEMSHALAAFADTHADAGPSRPRPAAPPPPAAADLADEPVPPPVAPPARKPALVLHRRGRDYHVHPDHHAAAAAAGVPSVLGRRDLDRHLARLAAAGHRVVIARPE